MKSALDQLGIRFISLRQTHVIVRDSTRRRFLRTGGVVGIAGLTGCSQITGGNDIKDTDGDGVIDSEDYAPRDPDVQDAEDVEETNSADTDDSGNTNRESFQDDFEYQDDSLSENGWEPQNSSIQASNSYLTTSSNENKQFVYREVDGFSEIELNGVQNSERVMGLRIILSETRNGVDSNRIALTVQQDRNTENFDYGSVLFYNSKYDKGADVEFMHEGELNDYRIVKNPDGTAELFINGSSHGQISNVDGVNISYIGIGFDAPDQRIDFISYTA